MRRRARGAAKLRINPGNIGGLAKATREVIAAAAAAGIPIRIGVNAGSLDDALAARDDLTLPEKLAASATDYVRYFEGECDFHDIVVSAKAHDVQHHHRHVPPAGRASCPRCRCTSASPRRAPLFQGIIKSACGLGVLLEEGIGDTLRISLTDDPVTEVRACWTLLGVARFAPPHRRSSSAAPRAAAARWTSSGWPGRWRSVSATVRQAA